MNKSADAFRTISEVAEWLDLQTHVLRFWESKFSQVKPVKRAGGRRYYRPNDMLLLGGIKKLLHDDGMTIKGVQKTLREQGVKYVASLSQPLDGAETLAEETDDVIDVTLEAPVADPAPVAEEASPAPELTFSHTPAPDAQAEAPASEPEPDPAPAEASDAEDAPQAEPELAPAEAEDAPQAEPEATLPDVEETADAPEPAPESEAEEPRTSAALPAFLKPEQAEGEAQPAPSPALHSDAPDTDPADNEIDAAAGPLSRLAALRQPLDAKTAQSLAEAQKNLLARLSA